jgi:N-acetylglutamate synthase
MMAAPDEKHPRLAVLALEEAVAQAGPPAETARSNGWLWRWSGGGTRRGNSVLPLRFDGSDLDQAISSVEARYRERGLDSYFLVSSIAEPPELDARLAAQGYVFEEQCCLLSRHLGARGAGTAGPITAPAIAIEALPVPTPAWLNVYTAGLDPARVATTPGILARVPANRAFLLACSSGEPIATALGVVVDGVLVIECVATRADRRRSGAARAIMDAVEAWGLEEGAHTAALQVVAANSAARRLYEGRGYYQVATYHYRKRALSP